MLDQATMAALTAEPLLQAKLEQTLESFATLQGVAEFDKGQPVKCFLILQLQGGSVEEGSPIGGSPSAKKSSGCCIVQ